MRRPASIAAILAISCMSFARTAAQPPASGTDSFHRVLDQILDINVRDGLVYYRALRGERGRLDRYAASLNVPAATYEGWSREQQMAFWVNAYNVFVLQTVISNYPIRGRSAEYPATSIRQIPGAFDRIPHRAAGRTLTLDEIEKTVIPEFKEPRLHLALGRGAIGSGRLRSEAYTAERMKSQLDALQAEFVTEQPMLKVDRTAGVVSVTPILSWHDAEFIAKYDPGATGTFAERSPIERALVAFIMPHLLPLEREFLQMNRFKVTYHPFDWRLNDLSGGRVN
ncbi:MAG: DUF547 domain-containing protein [Acidobacteria bacterium]|nr:DUF547 domain-containing protein [Acidobacteriota bacterium]MCA1652277.1 DUF547 domain-containing protein [Acidobacteriota bacterium]